MSHWFSHRIAILIDLSLRKFVRLFSISFLISHCLLLFLSHIFWIISFFWLILWHTLDARRQRHVMFALQIQITSKFNVQKSTESIQPHISWNDKVECWCSDILSNDACGGIDKWTQQFNRTVCLSCICACMITTHAQLRNCSNFSYVATTFPSLQIFFIFCSISIRLFRLR